MDGDEETVPEKVANVLALQIDSATGVFFGIPFPLQAVTSVQQLHYEADFLKKYECSPDPCGRHCVVFHKAVFFPNTKLLEV